MDKKPEVNNITMFPQARRRERSVSEQLRLAQKDLLLGVIRDLQAFNLTRCDTTKVSARRQQLSLCKDAVHTIKAIKNIYEDLVKIEGKDESLAEERWEKSSDLMQQAQDMLKEAGADDS